MSDSISTEQQLGQLLRGARKNKSMSQAELALQSGFSQARLSTLELNPGRLTVAQLLNVLNALDLTLKIGQTPQAAENASPDQGEW